MTHRPEKGMIVGILIATIFITSWYIAYFAHSHLPPGKTTSDARPGGNKIKFLDYYPNPYNFQMNLKVANFWLLRNFHFCHRIYCKSSESSSRKTYFFRAPTYWKSGKWSYGCELYPWCLRWDTEGSRYGKWQDNRVCQQCVYFIFKSQSSDLN